MEALWQLGLELVRTGGQRVVVYGAGFVFVYALSLSLTPEEFGRFSLLQSSLEIATIVGTAGLGLVISNETIRNKGADISTYLRHILIFYIMSATVLLLYLVRFVAGLDVPILVGTLAALTGSVIWTSVVYTARGLGKTTLFVLEPAVRSLTISVVVFGVHLSGVNLNLEWLLAFVAIAYLLSSLLIRMALLKDPRAPHSTPTWRTSLTTTMSGSFGFLSRKADLLILAPFVAPALLGDYKLAFVLAEVPYQIAITVLVHNQKNYLSFQQLEENGYVDFMRLNFGIFVISLFIIFISPSFNIYFFPRYNFSDIIPYICIYFAFKGTQFYYDYMLNYNKKYKYSAFANLSTFIFKVSILGASSVFFGRDWYLCLPVLAMAEFVSWEIAAYAAFSRWPFMSFLLSVGRARTSK